MSFLRFLFPAILSAALLAKLAAAQGGEAPDPAPGARPLSGFANPQPTFLVRAEVNHQTRSYREGDTLSVRVACEVDAWLYVLYRQADGKLSLVYPNSHQKENRLRAHQAVSIPDKDDLFRWTVGQPFGQETLIAIAAKERLDALSLQELTRQRFNPVSQQQQKGIELELGRELPAEWASVELTLNTYPRAAELSSGKSRRIGVFFGVSQYLFNTQYEGATGGQTLNLATCHRDARELADLLKEVGELGEVQVHTNEQSTRAAIESALTQWLPRRSRPGDTVLIYFSGHGMQIDDDGSDEADRKDEIIVPSDFVSLGILERVIEQARAGTLNPALAEPATRAMELVKQAGSLERAEQALSRGMGISDDLFGHWLQQLDGRQIVVVLDSCHSGGFFTSEKDLLAQQKKLPFDFLDGELGRLKDLGQREMSLLSACSAHTTASVRQEEDLSVLTYYLVQAIRNAKGPLTLDEAYGVCKPEMDRYFRETNARLSARSKPKLTPHEPFLFSTARRPVFLKP